MKRILLTLLLLVSCDHHQSLHPNLQGHWNHPPTIEICAESTFDRNHILDQFDWWYNEISDVYDYEEVIFSSCHEDIKNGTIRVEKFDSGKEYLDDDEKAAAFAYFERKNGSGHMNWVHIYLRGTNSDRTIRHEIGHAFGWEHFDDSNHLMYSGGGEETYELEDYPQMN